MFRYFVKDLLPPHVDDPMGGGYADGSGLCLVGWLRRRHLGLCKAPIISPRGEQPCPVAQSA